ncbi:formate dehydrogenase accessory sulfurtransferase FdhD [Effusibacillus dendaii]|uniref:Sulfur carrier protein FdhD n=1 Tax=Effusibacillus dendaii TaxID=2743772 RepID=A0A7I8D8B0_9BACL|nr:formate dehydrogenase accessory sulfurtransferase FdhD [Effusibacillus dendaii]BCJ86378.1 sulfurtransferase FdhD [Effusibacillus dendaii]
MGQGKKGMPVEYPVTLHVNDEELLTIQLTPVQLEEWTIGFLFGEGMITRPDELEKIVIDEDHGMIWTDIKGDVKRRSAEGKKRFLTSGCGKGITFSSFEDAFSLRPVNPSVVVKQELLTECMRFMYKEAVLYQETGGMHAAAVASSSGPLFVKEDIGRHNAVDKAIGTSLKMGLDPNDIFILTTGRISYEMVTKVARFGGSVVASRTAATDQAVRLAEKLGIEVVGYIRGQMMQVYTGGSRILPSASEAELHVR